MLLAGHPGICHLAVVPCRSDASDRAEIITQLLFGETFRVLEIQGSWAEITTTSDQYTAWMDTKQGRFMETMPAETAFVTSVTARARRRSDGALLTLLKGSSLPGFQGNIFKMEKEEWDFEGEARFPGSAGDVNQLLQDAADYMNSPYLWGGRSPFGIDCSGFTQVVCKINNIPLPRDSGQQALSGKPVTSLTEARAGDLAFFSKEKGGKVSHVGFLMDGGKIIHASGQVRMDDLREEGIYNREQHNLTHRLHSIRRIGN